VQGIGAIIEIGREWTRFWAEALGTTDVPDWRVRLPEVGPELPRDRLPNWLRETGHIWQPGDARFGGMIHLFHSDYWKRVWITQELLLADPETHVYICGTASMTEADLDRLCGCILTVFEGDKIEGVDNQVWADISVGLLEELGVRNCLSVIQRGLAPPGLMFVLYISGTRSASDPRDAVYGLLSLISDHGIAPVYGKPVWEVYAEWAAKAMLESGSMDLLSYVTTKEERRTNLELDLPSWVPDICNYKGYRRLNWIKKEPLEITKGCHGGRFSVELCNNGRVLKAEGRRLDTVRKITQLPQRPDGKWDMVRFCMDYMISQRQNGRCYPTGIPLLQALLRLALGSRIRAFVANESSKRIHEEAAGFIFWLLSGFISRCEDRVDVPPEVALSLAASVLGFGCGDDFPESYREMVFPGVDVRELMGWNNLLDIVRLPSAVLEAVSNHMLNWVDGQRLIETEEGYIGVGPRNARPGDRIFVVRHCGRPLVFRDSDPASNYITLLGPCDIVGMDNGEVDRDGGYENLWIA
jgi:hypothetical protein